MVNESEQTSEPSLKVNPAKLKGLSDMVLRLYTPKNVTTNISPGESLNLTILLV